MCVPGFRSAQAGLRAVIPGFPPLNPLIRAARQLMPCRASVLTLRGVSCVALADTAKRKNRSCDASKQEDDCERESEVRKGHDLSAKITDIVQARPAKVPAMPTIAVIMRRRRASKLPVTRNS